MKNTNFLKLKKNKTTLDDCKLCYYNLDEKCLTNEKMCDINKYFTLNIKKLRKAKLDKINSL